MRPERRAWRVEVPADLLAERVTVPPPAGGRSITDISFVTRTASGAGTRDVAAVEICPQMIVRGLPLRLGRAGAVVRGAREREQQIRQPIHVSNQHAVDGRIQRDDATFGAAADGAGEMERGAG